MRTMSFLLKWHILIQIESLAITSYHLYYGLKHWHRRYSSWNRRDYLWELQSWVTLLSPTNSVFLIHQIHWYFKFACEVHIEEYTSSFASPETPESISVACWCLLLLRMSGLISDGDVNDGGIVVVLRAVVRWLLVSFGCLLFSLSRDGYTTWLANLHVSGGWGWLLDILLCDK